MKRTVISTLALGPALLLAALVLPGTIAAAGPITSTACTDADGGTNAGGTAVTCNLWAKAGTLALPGTSVPIWGFADAASASPMVPGPVLVADAGDQVTVNLTNDLGQATSIVFGGQAMVPDLTGVAPAASTSYTFTATTPGTYLYEAGLLPGAQYQAAMGLHGILVIRPAGAAGQAYADPSTAFADEAPVVIGEIDPALNTSATPWTFDLRGFAPRYFLVNGKAYTSATAASIGATGGSSLLLRYANAGIQHHSVGVLGLHQAVLAADGSQLPYPRTMVAETLAPGQTADVLVALPATTAASTKYPLYDAGLALNNSSATGIGGMFAMIDAAAGGSTGGDTVGPIASGLTLTESTTAPGTYTLTATVSDATTGNGNVAAAEYKIDGITTAMDASDTAFDSPTEAVTSATDAIDTAAWTSGTHVVYVRGRDALGNWGTFATTSITIGDRTGPSVSGLSLTPNPSNGLVPVALAGTASDATTGNSNVTAAEYFVGATEPGTGSYGLGQTMTLNKTAPTVSITATIPAGQSGTVWVHARDANGNWGLFATIDLVVDGAGPATSGVTANPNPTNGKIGVNSSTPAVRVTATFSDASSGGSTIAAGEAFLDAPGANGTGFPFVANDGVFNLVSESGYADIPLTTILQKTDGSHTVYVHGKDAAGNWGALDSSLVLVVDKTAPTVGALSATPNPTNTTTVPYSNNTSFTLSAASAGDATTSVVAGEWWEGADPGAGNGVAFATATSTSIDFVARDWAAGNHTVNARVRDAAGNWSTVASTVVAVVLPDNVFGDSFGSGSTSAWSSTSGTVGVTAGASLDGSPTFGMATALGGTAPRYVADTTPRLDAGYHARFYLNPNGALLANNNSANGTTILAGLNAANTAVFQVQMRRQNTGGGTYQVRLAVLRAGGTTATSWFNITNAAHRVGVAWQSAASASASLVVDGTTLQALTGLNTSAYLLDAVRLGPSAGLVSTATGTLYFDAFASTRRTATETLP